MQGGISRESLLRGRGRGIVPAGDQQLADAARQHRAIGIVIVASARDAVGEMPPLRHVFLGHDIDAVEQPRLANADLRRDVDHEGPLEAGHLVAHESDQRGDALAPLEIGAREIFDLDAVEARHVRAIAPDDARQRRLQPPFVPGAADDPLRFAIDRAESAGLLVFETLGRLDIDAAEAEHGRDDIGAVGERRAGRGGDVEIAAGVDDDLAHDRLPPALGLADDAGDAAVLDDRAREPAMQPQVDLRLADHRVGDALEAVGIERGGVADRLRLDVRMKVEHAPARPFAPQRLVRAALGFRRHDAEADPLHAIDHLAAQAAHADFFAVAHVVEHEHHAARGEAAEIGVALQQRDRQPVARARDRRRDAGGAAADDDEIGAPDDRDGAAGFDDMVRVAHFSAPGGNPSPALAGEGGAKRRMRGRRNTNDCSTGGATVVRA